MCEAAQVDPNPLPDFLNVSLRPRKPRKVSDVSLWSPLKGTTRPESERWARAERFTLNLYDHATRIGSGIRTLWVLVGRKRVGLSDGTTTQVIPRAIWNDLARKAIKLQETT